MQLSTVGKRQQYGLVKKGNTTSVGAAKVSRLRPSVFKDFLEDDNDDDDDVQRTNRELSRRAAASTGSSLSSGVDESVRSALESDPSAFDYDAHYEHDQREKTRKIEPAVETKEPPKAKYMANLLANAKVRERERERQFDRKLLKERQEAGLETEGEKFVTAAYKQKLLEREQWEYEERLAAEVERKQDVRTRGMESFYANLLTKNIAMSAEVEKNAISAFTAGSVRQSVLDKSTESVRERESEKESVCAQEEQERESVSTETAHTIPHAAHREGKSDAKSSSSAESSVPESAPLSKEEQLAAARKRYLERKRSHAAANSDGNAGNTG